MIPFGFSGASKHISNTIYLKIGFFKIGNKNHIADKFNKHFNNALLYTVSSLIDANPDRKSECNNTESSKKAAYVPKSYT